MIKAPHHQSNILFPGQPMGIVPCYQFAEFLNIHGPYSLQIRLNSCTNSGDQAVNMQYSDFSSAKCVSLHHREAWIKTLPRQRGLLKKKGMQGLCKFAHCVQGFLSLLPPLEVLTCDAAIIVCQDFPFYWSCFYFGVLQEGKEGACWWLKFSAASPSISQVPCRDPNWKLEMLY